MKHIVVVGAGQAGFSVVSKLRNLQFDGSITLIGNEACTAISAPTTFKKIPIR
jgi:3-phenylpropionate/trans-cinnamate dioxygenase ferredoxin reductase subunit